MKDCDHIRGELSAYLDGELTPPQRTEVETHLASCAECQRELVELKTLVTGVAALPKLQPTPRFLADVRRKIASDGKPGALTWQDYVFRPLWLKIPLEVAALIVITGLVIRSGHPLSAEKTASLEFAKAENRENLRENTVSSGTRAKQAIANEPKSAVAAQMPTAAGPGRTPVIGNADEVSATPPLAPSPVIDLVRSVEFPRSKPGEIVTVHARVFDDVRNRAQQLATRCNGRVVVVPQSKDVTERTLFVEMPREYVAAFKLELSKTTGPSAAVATGGSTGESGTASAAPSPTGVLTGNAPTNNSADGLATFGLGNDATIAAPTTLLEIRVVAPAN
ncbi:MAG TPA: zf-HC2 domain-containing protein [Verrucomicrobiae bacterium]|nr:zf-HC2 domain-containing protein [Verrucomicrobiae bacterium]